MKKLEKLLEASPAQMLVDRVVNDIWKVALPVLRRNPEINALNLDSVANGVADKIRELE